MGIDPNASSNKRPRSDSDGLLQGRPDKRSLLRHSPLSARKARDQSPVQGQPSTPAQPSSHTNTEQAKQSPINEEDEELFASVRQIREAMDDSISFFQSSVQREEDLERFRSSHGSAGSPPGMNASVNYIKPDGTRDWRAYAEQKLAASMRESQSDASASAGKRKEPPPAYRNRVSKFLSKEKYADIMMQKRRDLEQRDRGETREKYTPLRHRQVDRPVERKEEHAEEVDTSMVEMEVPRQADHVWKQQHAPAQQQRGAPEQQQQPSFSVHDDQQAASTPVKQPQRSPSQPTAAPSQQPWGSIDPALFGSSFGPETAKKAPDKQQPSTSRWVQTTSQRPQQATQIIDLGSSPPPPERSERQVSPLAQAPTTAPAVKTHERPPSRDSIFTPEASFSYGPHATSQWGADLGSSSLDPETNIGHPQVDNNHVRDAIIAPLDQPSQVEAQQTQSDTSARSRPFGFGSGMGVGPGGFDIGQTSFASTSFGQPIAGSVQQQQQNAHSSGFRGMGHVEETQRVEDSVQKPQRTASQEPITQVMATTTAQAMQAPDFILDEGGDTEPDPSRPASRAEQHQDQPRMTTERPSPPPLKRQRSSPEDMRQNAKSRPNKARKQEKPSRNISANRFDLLAALGGEADGADDDSKSVSSTAESPASQPPVRRSRSPQKQSQQQPIQISSDATIDPNDEQYQPQHPNGKDLNDGFLASQMQLHLDPQAQQAQRVLDRLSPTAIDRHRSRSRSVTPSRFAADLQSRGQSEEAPASGEDVDDHQHSAEPNGFHVREHSAASTTSPSGSASRSESRDPNDDGAYDDIAEDVNGDTEAAFDGLDDVQYDTAPSQPRDADVGFDDGLEYADDEAEEDGYGDEEDYNDGMEDDQEGLEEMEEDEVSDADEDEGEDDQPTPKPVRRPQQQQQQPQKQVLINGKSGASAEDAIEL